MKTSAKILLTILLYGVSITGISNADARSPGFTNAKSSGPIEITANSLEVLQEKKQAIFQGNVIAKQGDVKLRAERMNVFYRAQEDKTGDMGAISHIEVIGNVFLSTPTETAKGDNGTYDVDHEQINLTGNVVLTRGQNVLKGSTLVYDMAKGQSILKGGANSAEGAKPGRVRGVFVPGEQQGQ